MTEVVRHSSGERIAVLTLDPAEAQSAVAPEAAIDRLEDDPEAWVGVLCANTADHERPVFCAGAELEMITETGDGSWLDTEPGGFAGFVYRDRTSTTAAGGGLSGLPRAGGQAAAMGAILTGEPTDARRAFDRGLVRRLVEPGAALDEARRLARQTASSPLAVRAGRRGALAASGADDATPTARSDALPAKLLASRDAAEGLTAVAEKRPPQWKAR